jgi:hypothetical protein
LKTPPANVDNTMWKGEERKKGEGESGEFNPSWGEALNLWGKRKIEPGTL